jgi:hypothetical protein
VRLLTLVLNPILFNYKQEKRERRFFGLFQ